MRQIGYFLLAIGCLAPAVRAQQATLYEGARLITGDGSAAIADGAFAAIRRKYFAYEVR